jgi:hypothetical protein
MLGFSLMVSAHSVSYFGFMNPSHGATLQPLDAPLARTGLSKQSSQAAETVARVAAEFLEMPGLSVTLAQAARLFDLPLDECERLLKELQQQRIIHVTPQGQYRLTANQ